MRSHLRSNAVAYLALFVALGGTSFAAATTVTSRQVKDRSLRGLDIRKDSLTGTEVRESSLGAVPRAAAADSAARATTAGRADDAAALGGKGPGAFLATGAKAADADSLDGLDSAQFLRTSIVTTAVATTTIPSQIVYTDPVLGFELRTNTSPTDAVPERDLIVWKPAGVAQSLRVLRSASSILLPGGIDAAATLISNDPPTLIIREDDPSLVTQITCAPDFSAPRVVCMIIRSRN